MAVDYKSAGVDIEAGNRAVELMKDSVRQTYNPHVLAGVGSFGGLFSARAFADLKDPVLVASTDGVGTKTKLAVQAGRYGGLGADIVNHCVNDLLVQGARPLFFLDYIAMGKLEPERVAEVVRGAAAACKAVDAALLGGETAEMPGVYLEGELDLVGTLVGVVDREKIVDGSDIQEGDVLIGLPSTGLHTNGYSLARKILEKEDLNAPLDRFRTYMRQYEGLFDALEGKTLFDLLLEPHREYLGAFRALEAAGVPIHGMAHITGGGLIENLPRIFPEGLGAEVQRGSWEGQFLFYLLSELGQLEPSEAHRALNMGVGYVFVVPQAEADRVVWTLEKAGEVPSIIGEIVQGQGVALV